MWPQSHPMWARAEFSYIKWKSYSSQHNKRFRASWVCYAGLSYLPVFKRTRSLATRKTQTYINRPSTKKTIAKLWACCSMNVISYFLPVFSPLVSSCNNKSWMLSLFISPSSSRTFWNLRLCISDSVRFSAPVGVDEANNVLILQWGEISSVNSRGGYSGVKVMGMRGGGNFLTSPSIPRCVRLIHAKHKI